MADPPTTLRAFLASLTQADIVGRPEGEGWAAHVAGLSVPDRIAEVSEEDYDYWLEVLPPRYQRGSTFCFAEGAEALRLFWYDKLTNRHLCRQLTWDETITFCRLAGIPLPS